MSNYFVPGDDAEDVRPGLDPMYQEMLLAYLLGQGGQQIGGLPTTPSLYPEQVNQLYGAVPGQLNPTQQGNFLQDYLSIMMDPAVAAMFGLGSYGADAFAPTTEYEVMPPSQGQANLQSYVQNNPGTIEAYIAEQILGGGTASSAIAELRQASEANPDDPEVSNLVGQLPVERDLGQLVPDWEQALQNAQAMAQTAGPVNLTPQGAIIDPQTGEIIAPAEEMVQMMDEAGNPVTVRVQREESPMAQWFRDRGLSLPTDQYAAEDFLGQDWQQGQARFAEVAEEYRRSMDDYLRQQQNPTNYESDLVNILGGGIAAGGNINNPLRNERIEGRAPGEGPAVATTPAARDESVTMQSAGAPVPQTNPLRQEGVYVVPMTYERDAEGNPMPSTTDSDVINPLISQLIAEGQPIPDHLLYVINPDGSRGEPLPGVDIDAINAAIERQQGTAEAPDFAQGFRSPGLREDEPPAPPSGEQAILRAIPDDPRGSDLQTAYDRLRALGYDGTTANQMIRDELYDPSGGRIRVSVGPETTTTTTLPESEQRYDQYGPYPPQMTDIINSTREELAFGGRGGVSEQALQAMLTGPARAEARRQGVDEPGPPSPGAQYENGRWTDAQGRPIGTAPTEDSAITTGQGYTPDELRQGAIYHFLDNNDSETARQYLLANEGSFGVNDRHQVEQWYIDNTDRFYTGTTPPQVRPRRDPEAPLGGGMQQQRESMERYLTGSQEVSGSGGTGLPQSETLSPSERNSRTQLRFGEYEPPQSEQPGRGTNARQSQVRFLMGQASEAGRRMDERRRGERPSRAQYARAARQQYGADYGRAVATAYLLQQAGVTPLQQQLAARRQVPIGMGLVGSGYLPGMGG